MVFILLKSCKPVQMKWGGLKSMDGRKPGLKVKHLEFKDRFRKQLLSGEKRVTVRLNTTLKEGDRVLIHGGGEILGEGVIEKVERKRPEELTEEDAKADGFKSLSELLGEIRRLYGDVDRVFVIRFSMKPFRQGRNPHNFYYGQADLREIAELALKNLQLEEKDRKILQLFLESGSIIKAARKLGGLRKRGVIREVLRKCYRELVVKGIIDCRGFEESKVEESKDSKDKITRIMKRMNEENEKV